MEEPKDRLKLARTHAGFESPSEASRAHREVNKNTLISHENGNRLISKKAADLYARVFKVSKGWLLTGEGVGPDGVDKSLDAQIRHILPPDEFPEEYDRLVEDTIALAKTAAARAHKN